ncbi:MAG: heme exporter protein CcmB [Calditrichia bacterium]|jgi:heme exporter protein B
MFFTLLRKELLIELRSKEISVSMLAFGLTVILTFSFAFNVSPSLFKSFAPGLFWIMILFVTVLGLYRIFAFEKEFDAFSLMISAPVDRGLIFLAKWISGVIFLLLSELLILPPFILFLQLNLNVSWVTGIFLILLGDLGIMVIGSLISGLAMRMKMSEVLLPVLMFPLVSPVIIGITKATRGFIEGQPFVQWQIWILILFSFIVVFGLLGYTIFDHITEE